MSNLTDTLKLALDALKLASRTSYSEWNQDKFEAAISALRSALANTGEALDEPVQERRVQQQFMDEEVLYSAPPRREWVSLTSGEQTEIIERYYDDEIDFHDFARAIEAKLKEKNHGA